MAKEFEIGISFINFTTTIHVVKLIPCLSSKKKTMINKRKMATPMPSDDRQFKLGETYAM